MDPLLCRRMWQMPTVLRIGPYRFHFYSRESNEPPHIHVSRDDFEVKFWLRFPSRSLSSIPWQPLNWKQKRRKRCDARLKIGASISSLPMSARSAFPPQSFHDSPLLLPSCSSKSPCACRVELSAGKRSMKIFGSAMSWRDDFRNSTAPWVLRMLRKFPRAIVMDSRCER